MRAMIFAGILGLLGCGHVESAVITAKTATIDRPQQWEHGWKTSRVIATRVTNKTMGQFVKFEFPKNGYNADRLEISQFIEMCGGNIFEGGGSPFAPAYATFKDAKDIPSTDSKLKEILPGLTELLANLDNKTYTEAFSKKYDKWDKAHNPQWPDTTAPDKTDPYWKFNNNIRSRYFPSSAQSSRFDRTFDCMASDSKSLHCETPKSERCSGLPIQWHGLSQLAEKDATLTTGGKPSTSK